VLHVRLQPDVTQTTAAAAVAPGAAATAASSVISYEVIVDVANADERLRPGMTAEVVLSGLRRERAVRIPDGALQFQPPPDVLTALGESGTPAPSVPTVWKFDGTRLIPITVRAGLSGDGWTELLSGPIRSGDTLVTGAVVQRRSGP